MANCYGCPYRWHDSDCEYCSAKGDEIIDSKSYSKETCSIYKSYAASKGQSSSSSSSSGSSSSSSSSSSSGNGGCIGCGVVIVIIALIMTLMSTGVLNFGGKKAEEKKEPATQTAVVYNVDRAVNMRKKPDSDSEHIVSVPKGETVEIIKKSGKWYLVKYEDYEGYCYGKYLDIQD